MPDEQDRERADGDMREVDDIFTKLMGGMPGSTVNEGAPGYSWNLLDTDAARDLYRELRPLMLNKGSRVFLRVLQRFLFEMAIEYTEPTMREAVLARMSRMGYSWKCGTQFDTEVLFGMVVMLQHIIKDMDLREGFHAEYPDDSGWKR